MAKKTRIVLADDHPITLVGLRTLIEREQNFELVGEATSGAAALDAIMATNPDLAIFDISRPQMNGVVLARHLATECPSVGVIALTSQEDRSYLDQALDAGVRGYVLKKSATACLLHAIRGVLVGGLYVDPSIDGQKFPPARRTRRHRMTRAARLTERETDVLKFVASGLTNRAIAARLDLSTKSVETYRSRGAAKIGLKTRADIVGYAWLRRWLPDA